MIKLKLVLNRLYMHHSGSMVKTFDGRSRTLVFKVKQSKCMSGNTLVDVEFLMIFSLETPAPMSPGIAGT